MAEIEIVTCEPWHIIHFVLFLFLFRIKDVKITRQGFERRVVSQDLQLWLSNVSFVLHQALVNAYCVL